MLLSVRRSCSLTGRIQYLTYSELKRVGKVKLQEEAKGIPPDSPRNRAFCRVPYEIAQRLQRSSTGLGETKGIRFSGEIRVWLRRRNRSLKKTVESEVSRSPWGRI